MALKQLNSIGGFSVGNDANVVVYANSDIVANNLTVGGVSDLGPIGNVKITGGVNGQLITTDGTGNLSFTTVVASGGLMPYYIPIGETYVVPLYKQGLFSVPIEIAGSLEVDGILVQVS